MAKFRVLTSILQRIDHDAGFFEAGHPAAGKPKNVLEHHKGDIIEFHENDEYRIPELVKAGAIQEVSEREARKAQSDDSGSSADDKEGGDNPPSGAQGSGGSQPQGS